MRISNEATVTLFDRNQNDSATWGIVLPAVLFVLLIGIILWSFAKRHLTGRFTPIEAKRKRHINDAKNHQKSIVTELADSEQKALASMDALVQQERINAGRLKAINDIQKNDLYERRVFNIGVIGMTGAGKTGLLHRLTDPYYNYKDGMPQTVGKEEYESMVRSICLTRAHADRVDKIRQEDVFHWIGWAGEQCWTASADLQAMCDDQPAAGRVQGVHGLIFVADLAAPSQEDDPGSPHVFSRKRIKQQIEKLPEEYFKILFRVPITSQLKAVILFINKADTLQISENKDTKICDIENVKLLATQQFKPLIESIEKAYGSPPKVIVGSVKFDIAVSRILSTLVQDIFPDGFEIQNQSTASAA